MNFLSNRTVDEIEEDVNAIMFEIREVYDKIGKLSPEECTFDNVIKEISLVYSDRQLRISEITFPMHVSPDKSIRVASMNAIDKLDKFNVEMVFRMDIYDAIKNVAKLGEKLNYEESKLLKDYVDDLERIGLHLNESKRDKLKILNNDLSKLSTKYSSNLNEDKTHVIFTTEELKGLPADYLDRTKIEKGKHKITMSYPDVKPAMMFAENEHVRKTVQQKFLSVGREKNLPILDKIIQKRNEKAKLLGYDNFTEYVLKDTMIKTTVAVNKFLKDIKNLLKEPADKELKMLEDFKGGKIDSWDYSYYFKKYIMENYDLDPQIIKQYYPANHVIKKVFAFFKEIFDLEITQIKTKYIWHPTIKYFKVENNGKLLGHFYMDLFPRDGKYGHAAAFDLIKGYQKRDGSRQLPLGALVVNFTKPTKKQPSLLTYGEVSGTLLHELGHIIHLICSGHKPKYSEHSGFDVKMDFVEAPSQMLENWGDLPDIIKKFSKHYKTGEKIPDKIIKSMVDSTKIGRSRSWMMTTFFSMFDQLVHQTYFSMIEMLELWRKLELMLMQVETPPDTYQIANWGHIASSYGSKYYSYIYSKVIAVDLFSKFKLNGLNNKKIGKEYIDTILSNGSLIPEDELITEFLGRPFSQKNFLKYLN